MSRTRVAATSALGVLVAMLIACHDAASDASSVTPLVPVALTSSLDAGAPATPTSAAHDEAAHIAGDATRGEAIYGRCLACHSLEMDRTGPRHCGLIGRRAASVAGFTYSEAMKRSGIVWDEASLNRFLAAPGAMVPGTAMTWAGIPDAQERADLIAWLKQQNASASCASVPR